MFQPLCPLHVELKEPKNVTNKEFVPRSGHRVAVDDKYLYCWGGYNPEFWEEENTENTAYPLLKELWRYKIWTGEWKLLNTHGEVPSELASHNIIKLQNHLLHFGGTGVPFGNANTNCVYDLDLDTLEWKILLKPKTEDAENRNIPRAKYGHSMTQVGSCIYIVGGTCGYVYDCDVHKLDLRSLVWEEIPAKSKYLPEPRYRHEVIYYKEKLLMFGGGAGAGYSAFRLSKVDVFDLNEQTWENVMTGPSERNFQQASMEEYPGSRRCHSCVKLKDDVYVAGGLAPDGIQGDIWRFHLPTYQWTALEVPFPKPVYFHSAAVTNDGCMFILGGVSRIDDTRTNALQIMWLQVPQLKLLAWNTVARSLKLSLCKHRGAVQHHDLGGTSGPALEFSIDSGTW
ncbi:kelch domain-containing protein 10-like [Mercenaria mercenaria]|uniref:kelch domain-containing protein 10-like n=1 Tax=Mercenaria mercenaria TaxID=6596 RepID=UPI00234EC0D3|nr:kelch domain-containing protein 10-like [Mercenaria mercenaria]